MFSGVSGGNVEVELGSGSVPEYINQIAEQKIDSVVRAYLYRDRSKDAKLKSKHRAKNL
ncbi:hypothetical protein J4480_00730 [Candidatus Woesearchaeota archaeon]|nr:hypothetical protein [Candidatus Woesearchaeota archaeon]